MTWSYRPSLDGLRMLSMYLIVLFHAGVAWMQGSFIAVDLFFVLSGFLVTRVILAEIDKRGQLSLRKFYARRVRRLLPAAVVAVLGTTGAYLLVETAARRAQIIDDAQAALLYVANWRQIFTSNDYFAADEDASPFLHFWTLSIEEQFYVIFPLLVILALKAKWRGTLTVVLAVLLAASVASQIYWGFVDPIHAYYGTDARVYQLLAGALLGTLTAEGRLPAAPPRAAAAFSVSGMALFLVLTPTDLIPVSQSVRGFIATTAILAMVYGLMSAESQPLGRLLSSRVPVYLGTITYATYLWHWPILLILDNMLTVQPMTLAVLVAVLATAVAALSNEILEKPLRQRGRLDGIPRTVVVTGLATSVLAAVALVPPVLTSDRKPVLAADSQGTTDPAKVSGALEEVGATQGKKSAVGADNPANAKVPSDIDWAALDEEEGTSQWCRRNEPRRCTVVNGSGPHVLVIGDSQAKMFGDAFIDLAKEHDLKLSFNIVTGCPWQRDLKSTKFTESRQADCEEARSDWYETALPRLDPDVVIMLGRPRDRGQEWETHISDRRGKGGTLDQVTLRASRDSVDAVRRSTDAKVLLAQELVVPSSFQPEECLSQADRVIECAVPRPVQPGPSDAFFRTIAAERPHTQAIDLNRAVCSGERVCLPVVDDRVVWRDKVHHSPKYVQARRDRIWRVLRETGAVGT